MNPKILPLFLLLIIPILTFAQAPELINYQGIARDVQGNPLVNQAIDIRFSILSGGTNGNLVYQEEHAGLQTNAFGLFNLKVGGGTPLSGSFAAISWGTNTHFLQVEMQIPGNGTGYVNLGTSQMVSVPYALFAKDVQNKDDGDWTQSGGATYNTTDSIGIGTSQPINKLDVVGGVRIANGSQGQDKLLFSDSLGNVRWDTLASPRTFFCKTPNWEVVGLDATDNVACSCTITLSKRALVVSYFSGHAYATPENPVIVGLTFPGENLYWTAPSIYTDHQGIWSYVPGATSVNPNHVSMTRSQILEPGTHTISLEFASTGQGIVPRLRGSSLSGHVIPIE